MAGNKLRILARNIVDTATLWAVPAFVSTLPETFLQRQTERGRFAQSTGLVPDIHLTWPTDQQCNMVAFTRHNMSTAATLRERLYPAGSPSVAAYDTTALAAWSTAGLDTDITTHTDADFRSLKASAQYFPLRTDLRELVSSFSDAANPDLALQLGRMFAGKYFEFTYSPPFGGADLQLMDMSKGSRADDGTHVVDKKGKFRKFTLRLDFIPDADLPTVLALSQYLGLDKELFISLYPGLGGSKELYNMMACRQVDSPVFNPWQVGLHKNTMTFEET